MPNNKIATKIMKWRADRKKPHLTASERDKLRMLLSLLNERSQPNLNALMIVARDILPLSLNVKQQGYELARRLAEAFPHSRETTASNVGLACKASVQADLESEWAAHWCRELQIPMIYHRKIWEYAYVLQALHEHDCLMEGRRGLGFGCGEEPLVSYFAARGLTVLATDLAEDDQRSRAWSDTNQHGADPKAGFRPELVDRAIFDRQVSHRAIDMNDIPNDLTGYDFCWSVCAIEHLGSLENGLNFVANSLATLKPGGVAVHTTEYNIDDNGPTIDNWVTNLFQRHHFEQLAERLAADGHTLAPLDFSLGDKPLDRFVDLPPWHHETSPATQAWLGEPQHLKLSIDGFPATCFGLIVRKAG